MAAKTLPVRVDRLQLLLDSRGWSAYRLAQEIAAKHGGSMETAKAKLNSYLNGRVTRAGKLTLAKIAEVFGPEITPEWLAGLTDELATRRGLGDATKQRVDSAAEYDALRVTDAASFAQYQLQVAILGAYDQQVADDEDPWEELFAVPAAQGWWAFPVVQLADAAFWRRRLLRFAEPTGAADTSPELAEATEHLAKGFQLILAPWLAGGDNVSFDILALYQVLTTPTEADRQQEIDRRVRARDRLEARVGKATESTEPEPTDAEFGAMFKRGAKASKTSKPVTAKREKPKRKRVTKTRAKAE